MDRLKGKVALVTGAGRLGNIGLAICEAFLREGARGVIGTDLRTDEAEEITGRIASQFGSGRFHLLQHDVTSAGDWQRVVAGVTDEFGALDVLVNNAGISVHGGIETTSLDDLRKVMAVNHDALFLGMKACAPELAAAIQRFPGVVPLSTISRCPPIWPMPTISPITCPNRLHGCSPCAAPSSLVRKRFASTPCIPGSLSHRW